MPVVLIPIHFDRDPVCRIPSCQRSVVLRPFVTNDFMTGVPAVPGSDKLPMPVSFDLIESLKNIFNNTFLFFQVLEKMVKEIKSVSGISRVLYDLTPKPPGTTEWE